MNALTKVFAKQVAQEELGFLKKIEEQKQRLTHHLMPPTGWLNDPNGLCYFQGKYHVFFQYSPFEANGGLKFWGHYSSCDLLEWKYEGTALYPDTIYDCHGVYSGSAIEKDGNMHLFFTGNVKLDGEYDYINDGRESSTLHAVSEDGIRFETKEVAIHCTEYPEEYTCHIRDPKVWKEENCYKMILGGRKKNDQGTVLIYHSEDMENWEYERELTTKQPFGYMWECPDLFELSGQKILSVSPQGLERETWKFQNVYQSGYFPLQDENPQEEQFREWDMGFDFYAPQTFEDESGRRILIGWMGMPDADEEYHNPTAETEGWQHCLTVPRELTWKNGQIYQYPVRELEKLRKDARSFDPEQPEMELEGSYDMELEVSGDSVSVKLGENLHLSCHKDQVSVKLSKDAGAGRDVRNAVLPSGALKKLRILADTTAVEIYLNDGEVVFSIRYYPENEKQLLRVDAEEVSGRVYQMNGYKIKEKTNYEKRFWSTTMAVSSASINHWNI